MFVDEGMLQHALVGANPSLRARALECVRCLCCVLSFHVPESTIPRRRVYMYNVNAMFG